MALPQPRILLIGNTMALELSDGQGDGLRNRLTNAWVTDAVVTATLKTTGGAEVDGQSWPLTLAYVEGSKGVYRGTLLHSLSVVDKQALVCVLDAVSGAYRWHEEIDMVAAISKGQALP